VRGLQVKLAICYEFRSPLKIRVFDGLVWARGRAIVEHLENERWLATPTCPRGTGVEGQSFPEVTTQLIWDALHQIESLGQDTDDQVAFGNAGARVFATADGDADREWFRVADATGDGSGIPETLRPLRTSGRPVRIEFQLQPGADKSFEMMWVFIPIDTGIHFPLAERDAHLRTDGLSAGAASE